MSKPLRQFHVYVSHLSRRHVKHQLNLESPRAGWQHTFVSSRLSSQQNLAVGNHVAQATARRQFSSSRLSRANDDRSEPSNATSKAPSPKQSSSAASIPASTKSPTGSVSETTTDKHSMTETIVARATQLSHVLNSYTGTDYTPITKLREAIQAQEALAGARHAALATAQTAYDTARDQQAASHSELIQLLERKSSWANGDLERYMALVRSEHLDEQGVQKARGTLREAERGLEEARAELEKMERKRYHEEQVWSDTIRRNSTWVTCGLMAVNIVVLFVGLVVIEPWRRRRLVNEVGSLLDERETIALSTDVGEALDAAVEADSNTGMVVVKPNDAPSMDVLSLDASGAVIVPDEAVQPRHPSTHSFENTSNRYFGDSWASTLAIYRNYWQDMFSERMITLRRVDLTTTAVEGIAAGAAFMGLLFVMLRPR